MNKKKTEKERVSMGINREMAALGNVRSVIRETFEYGNRRAAEIGRDRVFDFSLGNPNVPAPDALERELVRLAEEEDPVLLHGYTSAQGDAGTRKAIAKDLRDRFGIRAEAEDLYLTCGAAAAVAIVCKALTDPSAGDEIVVIAPFFPEYRVFAEAAGARLVVVPPDTERFGIPFPELEKRISVHTKAVLINSPNNPSGAVLSEEDVGRLAELLEKRSEAYGHPVYLISDEPYRELVYDASRPVPFPARAYRNSIVCYSFSKSLSIPGERLGYVFVRPEAADHNDLYAAVCGAGRALGYVCAPSMMQRAIRAVLHEKTDINFYRSNRDLLLSSLRSFGFTCVTPEGAFYLFMKSPDPDAGAFCLKAREYELLLVPADSFGCPGYVRIAYCVKHEMIQASLPAFRALAKSYGLIGE